MGEVTYDRTLYETKIEKFGGGDSIIRNNNIHSIMLDPNDKDTHYNLDATKKKLKMRQQKQRQKQQKQQKQQNKDQKQNKNQKNKDSKSKDGQQNKDQNKKNQDKKNQDKKNQENKKNDKNKDKKGEKKKSDKAKAKKNEKQKKEDAKRAKEDKAVQKKMNQMDKSQISENKIRRYMKNISEEDKKISEKYRNKILRKKRPKRRDPFGAGDMFKRMNDPNYDPFDNRPKADSDVKDW
jgi:Ca-activated chloride channel family protein